MRTTVAVFLAILATLGFGQQIETGVRVTSNYIGYFADGAFLPDGRIVVRLAGSNNPRVMCFSSTGDVLWEKAIGGVAESMLVTTDGYVYVTARPSEGPWFVLALRTSDGSQAWKHTASASNLLDMRIIGTGLLVGARAKYPGTNESTIALLSLNRMTGDQNYLTMYRRDEHNYYDGSPVVRTSGQTLYLGSSVRQLWYDDDILLIRPDSGELFGRSRIQHIDFQVDATGNVYAGKDFVTRFNAVEGTLEGPAFSVDGEQQFEKILLSGGYVYASAQFGISKIRMSDGHLMWHRDLSRSGAHFIPAMRVDNQGRLHAIGMHVHTNTSTNWTHYMLNPATGATVDSQLMASHPYTNFQVRGDSLTINPVGDILLTGSSSIPGGTSAYAHLAVNYQTPLPANDTYACTENEILQTNGNGVLKNDKNINPAFATTTVISPPVQGSVIMEPNGEFRYDATGVSPGAYTFIYEVSRGTLSATATVTISVSRGLLSLGLTRNVLAGQNATLGTVTLSSPGPNALVTVSDDSSLVTTPASVTIPAGQTSAGFPVKVAPVISQIVTTVRASYGGFTRTAVLTLTPLIPSAIAFSPGSTVTGGSQVSARVVLNGVAGEGGRTVSIFDNSAYSTVPSQVTIPPGATQATFTVQTTPVTNLQISKITAAVTAGQASANLRIVP